MSLNRDQMKLLQFAKGMVSKKSQGVFDESQWRMTLRNIGEVKPDAAGHVSSKALTDAGFDRVMAFLERHGFQDRDGPHTWEKKVSSLTGYASPRQVKLINTLFAEQKTYTMLGICRRASGNEHAEPNKLTWDQASNVIEAFKDIIARETPKGTVHV